MKKEKVIEAIKLLWKFKSESDCIEAKTANISFPKKCYDTISSFSNKKGGLIIFGINEENNFSCDGVYDALDLQRHISDLCTDTMFPSIRPDILSFEFEGKQIVAVKIKEIDIKLKPWYYKPKGLKGGSYIRVGDKDDLMSDYEIYSFQSYNKHLYDDKRKVDASINDLDMEKVNEYFSLISNDKSKFSALSFDEKLVVSGIAIKDGDKLFPTLAGIMIFGMFPQSFFPQLFVACISVAGDQIGDSTIEKERFIDNRRVDGTIEEMLYETIGFMRRNMRTMVIIDKHWKRTDIDEYPVDALKETVANTLIHRDFSPYTDRGYISVIMYSDRVEIISPGALYGANTLDKLYESTFMEVRNPTIIRILEEQHSIIENRHTGITTIINEMQKYNMPKPEFYEGWDFFKVIFRKKNYNVSGVGGAQSGAESNVFNNLDEVKLMVLKFCNVLKSTKEIREFLNISSKSMLQKISLIHWLKWIY